MTKLITVKKAEEEIKRLQQYLDLVESYETDTVEKLIIKEYAYTNSIAEVVKRMNARGYTLQGKLIDYQVVLSIIKSKPTDDLHRMLKSGYSLRVRNIRNGGR